MKIWILNHYASMTFFNDGGRHYYFAKYLKKSSHEPVIFCSNAEHGTGKIIIEETGVWIEKIQNSIQVPYVFVKSRPYINNGRDRILSMLEFYKNVKKTCIEYAKTKGKPDVIYASSVHPLTLQAGIDLARHFNVKCVCEVRDLWPESFLAYGIVKNRRNPIMLLMYAFEKHLYKKADNLIFTIEGGYNYIKDRGWTREVAESKVFSINNGIDIEQFEYNRQNYQMEDEDLTDHDTYKIVYAGAIRHVNNVGKILDVAKHFNDCKTKFLIYGAGDEIEMLEKRLRDENITNVIFKGKIEKKYVPYIISKANLNLMDMQESNDIFRYGISPNKLFEYFAAKRPILMYQLNDYNPALKYGVGFVANTNDEIIEIIKGIINGEEKYVIPEEKFDIACKAYSYEELTKRLVEILER